MTRLLLVLSCIASLWVSGCSGDASSTAGPTPSVPTSSAPTSTPTPERETPEEFVRRWVEVANQLGRDGDPKPLLNASEDCAECSAIAGGIAKIYRSGGWIKGGEWTLAGDFKAVARGKVFVCTFELSIDPGSYKSSAEASPQTTTGGSARIRALVAKTNSELKMHEFVRLAQ